MVLSARAGAAIAPGATVVGAAVCGAGNIPNLISMKRMATYDDQTTGETPNFKAGRNAAGTRDDTDLGASEISS
jgi:hypothetical protein